MTNEELLELVKYSQDYLVLTEDAAAARAALVSLGLSRDVPRFFQRNDGRIYEVTWEGDMYKGGAYPVARRIDVQKG